MPQKNNHEIYTSLMDKSDGKGADGVLHPDLRAKADATYVNPRTPADDAEASYSKTRKRITGSSVENLQSNAYPLSGKNEIIRSDSAFNKINTGLAHAFQDNYDKNGKPIDDAKSNKIDADSDELQSSANKALNARKKYPSTGRTGPG